MAGYRSANEDEQFIRSYNDALIDLEKEFGVVVDFTARTSLRRGVLECRWSVTFCPWENQEALPICTYTAQYPNSTAKSLAAFLFASSIPLHRLVHDQFEARKRAGVIR